MEKHFSSFQCQDAAYNVILCQAIGNMKSFPTDVTKFDITHRALWHGIQQGSGIIAFFALIASGPITAGTIYATGWAMGEYLTFINKRS